MNKIKVSNKCAVLFEINGITYQVALTKHQQKAVIDMIAILFNNKPIELIDIKLENIKI